MEVLFFRVLAVSGAVSVVLLPLLALLPRWERRYAPQTRRAVWLAAAAVLLAAPLLPRSQAPVRLTMPDAVLTLPAAPRTGAVPNGPKDGAALTGVSVGNTAAQEAAQSPVRETAPKSVPWSALLAGCWLAGGAAVLIGQGMAFALARGRLMGRAAPLEGYEALAAEICPCRTVRFFRVNGLDTPMTLGMLRPVVLLPAGGADRDAVRHELFHIRRWDVGCQLLLLLACAVHWFNPLVWLASRRAGRDIEASCDAQVVSGGDAAGRRAYGELLLQAAAGRSVPLTTRFGGGKRLMKARLYDLFHPGKKSGLLVGVILLACLLAGSLVACQKSEGGLADGVYYAKVLGVGEEDEETGIYSAWFSLFRTTVTDGVVEHSEDFGEVCLPLAEAIRLRDRSGRLWVTPDSKEWKKEVLTYLTWPLLRSSLPVASEALELEISGGQVVSMTWHQLNSALYEAPYDVFSLQLPEDWAGLYRVDVRYEYGSVGNVENAYTTRYIFSVPGTDGKQHELLSLLINRAEEVLAGNLDGAMLTTERAFVADIAGGCVYRLCPAAWDDYYLSGEDPAFNAMLDEAGDLEASCFQYTGERHD